MNDRDEWSEHDSAEIEANAQIMRDEQEGAAGLDEKRFFLPTFAEADARTRRDADVQGVQPFDYIVTEHQPGPDGSPDAVMWRADMQSAIDALLEERPA